MSGSRKGWLLAVLQVGLVLSLGAKLLYDRATRPRVWVLTQVYDPELPIRGRYLSERLKFAAQGFTYTDSKQSDLEWYQNRVWGYLQIRDGKLIASATGSGAGDWIYLRKNGDGSLSGLSENPVLFFIPDTAVVPALKSGEEMWAEVTVPAKGPPRPIRIGIKKNGVLTPLDIR